MWKRNWKGMVVVGLVAVTAAFGVITLEKFNAPPAQVQESRFDPEDFAPPPDPIDEALLESWSDGVLTVGIVGDSITVGWMADAEETAWRSMLDAATTPHGDLVVQWAAVAGATSADALAYAPEAIVGAEVVIVELGTNDSRAQEPSAWSADYSAVLALVAPEQQLLCMTPWRRDQRAADVVAEACKAAGGRVVSLPNRPDLVGPEGSPAYPQPRDLFHPNQAGHDAIFARALSALTPTE